MGRKNNRNEMKIERTARAIVAKWLKKGNMARAMRDILPRSGLGARERNEVARLVHMVVRFKFLYDYALGRTGTADEYIKLAKNHQKLDEIREEALKNGRVDIYFSASPQVSRILRLYPEFAKQINREPESHIAVNTTKIERAKILEILRGEVIEARKCRPETCVVAEEHVRYSSVVKNGLAIVQDASSQQVAKLVASLGNNILDFCAGSGGKSFTIKFFNPEARVFVHDANEKKLNALFSRAETLGLKFEKFSFTGNYEVVMVDAPCSGLGAAARNPEAKYQEELDRFPPAQMQILNEAKRFVGQGGYLVYVVCTFNPDETKHIVSQFLENNQEYEELKLAGPVKPADFGGFFTDGDIMYIAVMRRI